MLTENFFQDNREDVAFLNSAAGFQFCVDVHVRGILAYIAEGRA